MVYKVISSVNGEYYFHYDNFGNTVLLTDEDGVPKYTALYDISNGKRVQEWNPNNLTFAIKGEGKEEKISFGISDIQISIYYDLIVRKIIPVVISGNWTWTDLMVKGGATLKTCGGKCPPDFPFEICECVAYYGGRTFISPSRPCPSSAITEVGYGVLVRLTYTYECKCYKYLIQ
jgi:hypothetical protein